MTNRERMLKRNTDRIAALTPEQIDAVHRIMSGNVKYITGLGELLTATEGHEPRISDMEIQAVLYSMAGTLQVTMALDAVLIGGAS